MKLQVATDNAAVYAGFKTSQEGKIPSTYTQLYTYKIHTLLKSQFKLTYMHIPGYAIKADKLSRQTALA